MPKAYPDFPYTEPDAADVSDADIEQIIEDLFAQTPDLTLTDGGPLDGVCRALNVDVEYSGPPNEILLDVPPRGKAVLWLPKKGRPRQDRMTAATGIGHWILHIPRTRAARPGRGIQCLHKPADPTALEEAKRFAMALLMPATSFTSLWYEGRSALTADVLNVPTQTVYDRAKALLLTDAVSTPDKTDPASVSG